MHKIWLTIVLGFMCCAISPCLAGEDESAEAQESCESDEPCATEEDEELERGFDPCLINAGLPACKSEEEGGEPSATELRPSEAEDTDDSG